MVWKGIPFKFNQLWLKDSNFEDLGWITWALAGKQNGNSYMDEISKNLSMLKKEVQAWVRKKKANNLNELHGIDNNIYSLLSLMDIDIFFTAEKMELLKLEGCKQEILIFMCFMWVCGTK